MAKITWQDRTDTGDAGTRAISASIFNDIKASVNAIYEDEVSLSGSILISGSIIPNVGATDDYTSSFNLGSPTAAWGEIYVATSSLNFVEGDGTVTKWSKDDVVKLREGKSLSKTLGKQLVNENDSTTYVRMQEARRAVHYVSDKPTIDLKPEVLTLGNLAGQTTGTPVAIPGGITGSLTTTGSVGITGSTEITGSVGVLPPPLVVTENSMPSTNTLFYGYLFSGGTPDEMQVQATSSYNPNAITYFRFSTSSQDAYNSINPTNQDTFFTNVSASASNSQFTDLTFTPVVGYPSHSYKFTINSVTDNGPYYQTNVTFVESSSLGGGDAPATINFSGGGANGRWKFVTNPAVEDEPTGGFVLGDLLNFLASFGATGIAAENSGFDFNIDGSVGVSDLLILLSGFGNPQEACSDIVYQSNTNNNIAGPVYTICDGYTLTVNDNAFVTIT
jgi:hypothetical protein